MTDRETQREEILRRRAEVLAREPDERRHESFASVAVVAVGRERLGLSAAHLREIIRAPRVARLPDMPPWMLGLAQIRGELVSVVDTAAWLGLERSEQAGFLAVVDGPEGPVGLLVDGVECFRDIRSDELSETMAAARSGRPVVATTKDLVAVLDMARILSSESLVVEHRPQQRSSVDVPHARLEPSRPARDRTQGEK